MIEIAYLYSVVAPLYPQPYPQRISERTASVDFWQTALDAFEAKPNRATALGAAARREAATLGRRAFQDDDLDRASWVLKVLMDL